MSPIRIRIWPRLREERVHVNEKLNIWMLARYNDVTAAGGARRVVVGIGHPDARGTHADRGDHRQRTTIRLRRAIATGIHTGSHPAARGRLGGFVTPGLDALAAGDVVDMVQALTVPLPVSAIAVLLGVDRSRWQDFRRVVQMTSPHCSGSHSRRPHPGDRRALPTSRPCAT